MPRGNRSSVYHNRWTVETAHGHNTSGHILVATRQCNQPIIIKATANSFNTICDQVPAHERITHAIRTVANTIADTNGIENKTDQVIIPYALLYNLSQIIQVHIAGIPIIAHAGNTNLGFGQIIISQSDTIQHRLGRRLCNILGKGFRILINFRARLMQFVGSYFRFNCLLFCHCMVVNF